MASEFMDWSFNSYFSLSIITHAESVCSYVGVYAHVWPKVLNLLCNSILKRGNKPEWSAPRGTFDTRREPRRLWDSTLSIWIFIPLSLSILCRLCVCAVCELPLRWEVHAVSVYTHFVFYCSQLSFCVCLCARVCIGSSQELLWTIVCDLHRPSAADGALITQQRGLQDSLRAGPCVQWGRCAATLPCLTPWPRPELMRSQDGRAGALQQLSFTLSSRWWHSSSSLRECEGGSSGRM